MLRTYGIKSGRSVVSLIIGLGLFLATADSALAGRGSFQATIDGAARLAQQKLADHPGDEVGRELLRFVLTLDADSEAGMLLLSALEDGMDIEPPADKITDGGQTFAAFLVKLADGFAKSSKKKSREGALLFYSMAKILHPENGAARVAVMKAKMEGANTDHPALLKSAYGKQVFMFPDEREANAGGAQVAPPAVVQPGNRVQIEERAGILSKEQIAEQLDAIRISAFSLDNWHPLNGVNALNGVTCIQGVPIIVRTGVIRINHVNYDGDSPCPRYYGSNSGYNRNEEFKRYEINDVSAGAVLRRLCAVFGVGHLIEDGKAVIVDRETEAGSRGITFRVKTDRLFTEFRSNLNRSLQKYKNKRIEVTGVVTGIGKGMLNTRFVDLNNDSLRLIVSDSDFNRRKLNALRSALDSINESNERTRVMKRNYKRKRRRYGDGVYVPPIYEYSIELTGMGMCSGYKGGRVTLEDGQDLYWEQKQHRVNF